MFLSKLPIIIALSVAAGTLVACGGGTVKQPEQTSEKLPSPPNGVAMPHSSDIHGHTLTDPYFWLRERESPQVLQYLNDENTYTDAVTANYTSIKNDLFVEMRKRIKETDTTAPYLYGEYLYYSRTEEGKNYPIHCRKKNVDGAIEEVLIDENKMAEGHGYFEIGVFEPSPDNNILAYSVDTKGNERYTLRFLDLTTGEHSAESIEETYYSIAWANDNKTVYYDRVDAATRPFKVFRHKLGEKADSDVEIFHEKDERFFVGVDRMRSGAYVEIAVGSSESTESHLIDANTPEAAPVLFAARQDKEKYHIEHQGEFFWVTTNHEAVNYKLMRTDKKGTDRTSWSSVLPHREDVTISDVEAHKDYVAIETRQGGIPRILIWDFVNDAKGEEISFPEPVYNAYLTRNYVFDTDTVRFGYTSLVSPPSEYDYNVKTKERTLVKQREVFNYDPAEFESQRIEATATDGTKIPISLVYKKGAFDDGPAPMLLTGYGSYGASYDVHFSTSRVSLLERGIVFGIAHIRGGGEMGRQWYLDGKYLKKKNTFTDFIACTEHLVAQKITAPDRLAISGRSAGGLLMGAVVNMRPELFTAVIAGVPFVDVINTMLDETIPLTVTEWEEWGDPRKKEYFDYMRSYSPYDNVRATGYPNMLITAGLNDPRVQYWEPAKWTAKLRATKTPNDNVLLLKTNMDAGHGGASGRYDYLKETAFEYAFLLDHLGLL